jgi:4-amino-4-deoxy-L-arabinose transferase-like glycosyltransferase
MTNWLAGARPYAVLSALCLLLYLPGIAAIPPLDRDEARFAQATRQMLETGDFLRIRFQNEARNRKPAGIYWLQAAAVAALSTADSTAIWPYRLPSVAGATASVLALFAFAAALFRADPAIAGPRRAAFTAALLLATALGLVAEAHIAKTDAVLLAATVAGQSLLGLAYLRARRGEAVPLALATGFWLAEAAAILVKGPVAPVLAVLTAATLSIADRNARWLGGLRPVRGTILVAAILAPWLIAIERATAGQFLAHSLGRDFLDKLIGAQDAHGAPPLSYLLLAPVTFWPGALWLARAAIGGWRRRDTPSVRFLLAWLVPYWLVIELMPTKLPNYALPA